MTNFCKRDEKTQNSARKSQISVVCWVKKKVKRNVTKKKTKFYLIREDTFFIAKRYTISFYFLKSIRIVCIVMSISLLTKHRTQSKRMKDIFFS
jgi:hypothetical protein